MGTVTYFILLAVEAAMLFWSIRTRQEYRRERGLIRIASLIIFAVLTLAGIYKWGFQYAPLLVLLVIQSVVGIVVLIRAKDGKYTKSRTIWRGIRNSMVLLLAILPTMIFPQYDQPTPSGTYDVLTTKYTWTDTSRTDEFPDEAAGRKLTVEFWYPDTASNDQSYPLVIFSHGAFGFSGSNYSTCAELASNGYVVAGIGHTHQAFFTRDVDGAVTIADADFMNEASRINAVHDTGNDEAIYNITRAWMKLRTDDENFVINQILELNSVSSDNQILPSIDVNQIGLMGHSLGGASSAQIGRERSDIDAVIVLDGTMLGEEIDYANGSVVLNSEPYPVPLLNIYAQDHYENAVKYDGERYNNFHATHHAVEAFETVFTDAGHLNFTDLPLFSPILARALGTGTVDELTCINTMNEVVLEFFNSFLKSDGKPDIQKEY
ncbi:MAG: hypothetical protein GXY22_02245 [Clostridiaceae bacterium]|jgi:dienelactone hydrolase|nr:dienelactone hydrolase family protein [Eubacteriales bacterium]NLV47457.1 hypothetical protein [Clostridiaceae bacterium]